MPYTMRHLCLKMVGYSNLSIIDDLNFNGGPNINPGIVSIERKISELEITVGRQDIKSECAAVLAKLSKKDGYHDISIHT
jgi:hypothetical protein